MHRAASRLTPVLLLVATVAGCSRTYNAPPTVSTGGRLDVTERSTRRGLVLDTFGDPPSSPVGWSGIGAGMTEALARTLHNHGDFRVRVDPEFAKRAKKLLHETDDRRLSGFARLRQDRPEVSFVVTGVVTDFTHTNDKPKEVRRWGLFGRKREAVVAIQVDIIDVKLGRVVISDHVHGVAPAPGTPSRELYADIAFGTYLFWNAPLGKASEQTIDTVSVALHRLLEQDPEVRVVKQVGPRRVELTAGTGATLSPGAIYYVCVAGGDAGGLEPVVDPDTRLPLQARIDTVKPPSATAWLLGRKPGELDLRGAVLHPELPPVDLSLADDEPGRP